MIKAVLRFFEEVRHELSKVHWLSRKEALISSGVVVVVVAIFSLIFVIVDYLLFKGIAFLVAL